MALLVEVRVDVCVAVVVEEAVLVNDCVEVAVDVNVEL